MNLLRHLGQSLRLVLPLTLTVAALSQDVRSVELFRTGDYQQFEDADPVPFPSENGEDPFTVLAVMGMSDEFLSDPDNLIFVRAVTLQPPSGSLRAMDFFEFFGGFILVDSFTSATAMQSAFRAGNYQYTFSSVLTGDEVFRMSIADAALPDPARVVNFAEAQQVNPADAFTLQWSPASPEDGGAELVVFDAETGEMVYDSDTLLGAVSSATIPANTLRAGRLYEAELTVTRLDVLEDGITPSQFATSASMTLLPLKTGSDGGGALAIQSIILETEGEVQLIIECQPGVPLEVQRSNPLGGEWQTIQTQIPAASPVALRVPLASFGDLSFLRAAQ